MTTYELLSALFAGGTLVAVIVAAAIYNGQLKEMQKSTDAATKAAKAAEKAAIVAEGQLGQMKSGSVQTDKIIAEAHRMSDAMEATLKQSQDALEATIATSRNDQRAWIGVSDVVPANINGDWRCYVTITNFGKTPARIISIKVASVIGKTFPLPIDFVPEMKEGDEISKGVVFPGNAFAVDVALPGGTGGEINEKTKGFLGEFKGLYFIYVEGDIRYNDAFQIGHHTHFCFYKRSTDAPDARFRVTTDRNDFD